MALSVEDVFSNQTLLELECKSFSTKVVLTVNTKHFTLSTQFILLLLLLFCFIM